MFPRRIKSKEKENFARDTFKKSFEVLLTNPCLEEASKIEI